MLYLYFTALFVLGFFACAGSSQFPPTNSEGGGNSWAPGQNMGPPPSFSNTGSMPPGWSPNGIPGAPPGWSPSPTQNRDNPNQGRIPTTKHHDIKIPKIEYNHQPEYDYADALAKSILFYEAQRSGKLPYDHRVWWRGDSALQDGQDYGVNLEGGYYDGGGYIKYGFPMAYTTTVLSWGVIRYRRTYKAIGQLDHVLDSIRWATEYFLKCKTGRKEFFGQVSDQESDSRYVGVPEKMDYLRKSYRLNEDMPGTDLVAETAAAMAAASIVFYETDRAYSESLIEHAQELYDFAATYPGHYHDSIRPAEKAYRSHSGYKDELAWAAAWIYRRTGNNVFMRAAKRIYKAAKLHTQATMFSWDDKKVGVQTLLAEITGREVYKTPVRLFCQYCLPDGESDYTPKGLLYLGEWGALRYAANAAFICSLASDMNMNPSPYRLFALRQIGYILGSTGRSYVVGFGVNPPTKYYHRASYCPEPPAACPQFSANFDNVHTLYGALVGGPSKSDQFMNMIEKREQSSVALDYNAGFQSALAAVLDIHIYGQKDRPKIDKAGQISIDNGTTHVQKSEEEHEENSALVVYNYEEVIAKSILFYEAQRSGPLNLDNRVSWRADSGLYDGAEINRSLEGGYYDGGDFVKYTYPLAFTLTTLSWGVVEYYEGYDEARQLMYVLDSITWGITYLAKCHLSHNEIVVQVGGSNIEALTWNRPKYMNASHPRPVSIVSIRKPGSDIVAESAAAFAAASLAFRNHLDFSIGDNDLILRAKSLYQFADEHPGIYTRSFFDPIRSYNSTGYHDELAWAALWIYKATNETKYLNNAKAIYNTYLLHTPETFSYDDKTAGVHLLMAEITQDTTEIAKFCNWITKKAKRTPKGLLYLDKIPTKHAANTAFILLMAAEKFKDHPDATTWKYFARDQIHYLLGSTGQGYVVGYGDKFPKRPYHKASSCPNIPLPCGFSYSRSSTPNPQILYGALVAGPDFNDTYNDIRLQTDQTAVSLDTNAGFQSAVAGLLHLKMRGLLNGAPRISWSLGQSSPLLLILFAHVWLLVVDQITNVVTTP